MEEVLSLKRGEEYKLPSPSLSWLGLVTSGDVTGAGDYQEIVWTIDDERQKAVVINSPASVTCRSHKAKFVWFKDYDFSVCFGPAELTVGQFIDIGLNRVLLLHLSADNYVEEFEAPGKGEGFVLKGEIQVEEPVYDSGFSGRIGRNLYREGERFNYNVPEGQLRFSWKGNQEALVFLVWEMEMPLADIIF